MRAPPLLRRLPTADGQPARRSQILQDDDARVLVSRQQAWRQPGVLGNLP
jgi:hypothetical protein